MSSSLIAMRASSEASSAEQKRLQERKKNTIILINHFLVENGYIEAAERLQHETNSITNKFTVADNIDLSLILGEYETYVSLLLQVFTLCIVLVKIS